VLRVFLAQSRTNQPYTVSLAPHSKAVFRVPPSVMTSLSGQLCSGMLAVKALHWVVTGRDARPRFDSSTPLLANLTTLEFGTICNNQLRMVSLTTTTNLSSSFACHVCSQPCIAACVCADFAAKPDGSHNGYAAGTRRPSDRPSLRAASCLLPRPRNSRHRRGLMHLRLRSQRQHQPRVRWHETLRHAPLPHPSALCVVEHKHEHRRLEPTGLHLSSPGSDEHKHAELPFKSSRELLRRSRCSRLTYHYAQPNTCTGRR
jgi:hypothetical protein